MGCPRVVPAFKKFMCSKFLCLFLALMKRALMQHLSPFRALVRLTGQLAGSLTGREVVGTNLW